MTQFHEGQNVEVFRHGKWSKATILGAYPGQPGRAYNIPCYGGYTRAVFDADHIRATSAPSSLCDLPFGGGGW